MFESVCGRSMMGRPCNFLVFLLFTAVGLSPTTSAGPVNTTADLQTSGASSSLAVTPSPLITAQVGALLGSSSGYGSSLTTTPMTSIQASSLPAPSATDAASVRVSASSSRAPATDAIRPSQSQISSATSKVSASLSPTPTTDAIRPRQSKTTPATPKDAPSVKSESTTIPSFPSFKEVAKVGGAVIAGVVVLFVIVLLKAGYWRDCCGCCGETIRTLFKRRGKSSNEMECTVQANIQHRSQGEAVKVLVNGGVENDAFE